MENYSMFMDRRLNIVKMPVPPNFTYRFNTIPAQTPANYFVDIDKLMLMFM